MPAGRPANPLLQLLGYHLRRASAAVMEDLSRDLAAIGLRPTEASVLVLISANPVVKSSEVGRVLGIQRANMTPLVARLERKGLIVREAVDGRSQGLSLTPAGEAACHRALTAMRAHDARLLQRAAPAGAGELGAVLQLLWDDARDVDDEASTTP